MKKWHVTVWALILSLALCLSLTACNGKTVDQLQNELGALLEGGGFEEGSVLNFNKVENASEKAEEIFEKLSGIGVEITDRSIALIYDISVTKDGKEVQPSGKVKLTIPVPNADAQTKYSVYHVKDSGEVVEISATYADGKLTFETDGFSYYVIVATSEDVPAPVEVTLIAHAGEGGTITDGYANGKKVEQGTSVTLTATASDGYHFVGWFLGDALVSEDVTYTFNVDEDMTLEARFGVDEVPAPVQVTLIANAGEGGTITDGYANGQKVEQGTSVTLTATASDGYHFVGWFLGDALVSEDVTYTFNVDEDMTLEARFGIDEVPAPVQVTLIANAGEGDSITDGYANGVKLEKGSSVTLTATADNGYHFVGWFVGQNKVSENATYTFNVDEDTTLVAQFEKDAPVEVTLIAHAGEGGSVTDGYANGKKVEAGTSVTLTATADNGYHFVGWFADNTKVSEDASYTFIVSEDVTLAAQFEKDAPVEFTVIANAGEGGSVTGGYANGKKVEQGTSVTLTATADNGYYFVGWYRGATRVSTNARYTFTVNEDIALRAEFVKYVVPTPVEFTVIARAGEGGTITDGYANGVELEQDTSVTLTATPDNGYHFVGWFVDNTKVSEDERYTFTVSEDITLVAQFEKDAPTTYRFLCDIRGNGTIWENNADVTETYQNGATLSAGAKITLTAKPDDGWEFKGWYRTSGETLISTETTYTFELTDDTVVYALFEEKVTYNFIATVTPSEGGYITENNQTVDFGNGRQVELGKQITLTAVANEDYNFKGWYSYTADQQEVEISTDATYTFTVNEAMTVFAKFEEKVKYNFIATVTPSEGGYITENDQTVDFGNGRQVEPGKQITLTAVANEDYNFKGWYSYTADQQEVEISTDATCTFTVNEAMTVFAKFEEKVKYNFIATVTPSEGGYITENDQTVDFGNGRQVEPGKQITLTAVANSGYAFKGWYNAADDSLIPAEATHTFTVNESISVRAVFEEKPNGLKLDAHNAGFTYNESGELVTTVYQIGDDSKPNAENVLVYATYPTQEDRSLTKDTDYTIDLGGLDFTKAGTYTVTYTYKADTSLKATLTVQVKEKPADGSLTEAEWNAAMAYWKAQTNVKVFERTVTSQSYDQSYGAMGAQIMIYQLAGTAYSYDGYMEDDELSQQYKGKMTYLVKVGDKYYRYTWNDGEWDDDLREYVNGFWVKEDYNAKESYESEVNSNIYACRGVNFGYENFTFDAETKSYKNSDGSISIAFTFDDDKVLTKIVVTENYADTESTYTRTTVSTITFGDAVVDVPTNAKCYFAIGVKTEDSWSKDAGYITENGEKAEYWYDYLDDGTSLTLTAVANDGYVFKRWAKQVVADGEDVWVTYSTDATYTVTADGEYGALYAVFEKVEAES